MKPVLSILAINITRTGFFLNALQPADMIAYNLRLYFRINEPSSEYNLIKHFSAPTGFSLFRRQSSEEHQ